MTTSDLLQTAAAMTAYAEGKPVQFQIRDTNEWMDCTTPEWNCMAYVYRPKPEAKRQEQLDEEACLAWKLMVKDPTTTDAWHAGIAYERSRTKP